MTLRQDLEALYERVQKGWSGWDRHGDLNYMGCLLVAMYDVTGEPKDKRGLWIHDNNPVRREARWRMIQALGFSEENMYAWNDAPERTWQEVQDRIKEAIARAPVE